MAHSNLAVRVAGTWLAIASLLLIAALVVHGPLAPDLGDQMMKIAAGARTWSAIHWVSALSLSLFAMTGLIVLTAGSHLTRSGRTMTAWALLTVSALWVVTTAVVEATVVPHAAATGATDMFLAWWTFAEGKASGIAVLALAVAAIAASEAQSAERCLPAWAGWIGAASGLASCGGWALARWFGVDVGNLLWVASSVVMGGWTLAFGVALSRSADSIT